MRSRLSAALCLLVLLSAASAFALDPCSTSERTLDGRRQIILENGYVRLVVEPESGGKIVSFQSKSAGAELVRPKLGILEDRFWQVPRLNSPWKGAYQAEFRVKSPERMVLALARTGEGEWKYNSIEKVLTLDAGSAVARVDIAYKVHENKMSAAVLSPWMVNGLAVAGEECRVIVPLNDGVSVLDYNPAAPPLHQQFLYNGARGWMAVVGQKSNCGMAVTLDESRLMAFYMWFGNNANTMEWLYNTVSVPHGQALESRHELIPFRGLPLVTGAGGGVAAQIETAESLAAPRETPVTVRLYSGDSGALRVEIRCEELPGRLAAKAETHTIEARADTTQEFTFNWLPTGPGLYAVHGEVFRGQEKVCDFERPVRVGDVKVPYALPPLAKRLGDPAERYGVRAAKLRSQDIPEIEFKDDIATPHVKWGSPYYRGPLRVFVLTDQSQARDIIELRQRFQIETVIPLAIANKSPFVGDYYEKYTDEMALFDLTERLKKRDFDVIVIGGGSLIWTEEHRKLIADLVREGKGLVWIGAPTPAELKDVLPLDAKNPLAKCAWSDPENAAHPLTRLMPLALLPATTVGTSVAAEDAQVLARAGGRPLVAVKEKPNAGRVAQLNYGSSWSDGLGATYAGLTPYDHLYAREPYPYWEYWYSLLGRAILWAGRFDAPVQPVVRELRLNPAMEMVVDLEGKSDGLPGLRVEAVVRGPYAGELARETKPWAGRPLTFTCDRTLAGRGFIDIRLLAQDKVIAWGTRGFVRDDGPRIREVKLDKGDNDVVLDGESVTAEAALEQADGCALVAELYDGLDRLLARTSAPAQAAQRVSLPSVRPLHGGGQVVLALEKDGRRRAEWRAFVTLLPAQTAARAWDDYVGIVWGQIGAYQKRWLGRTRADLMREMGFNVHNVSARWSPMDMAWPLRLGFQPLAMGIFSAAHNEKNDEEARKEYQKTGDKMVLLRKPSLSDPAYQAQALKTCREAVAKVAQFRPFAYNFGDEVSYAPNGLDYDFSEHALKDFRAWLRTQYPTVETLNAEWGAQFKDFDEAMPFTSREAVNTGRYAPWADLRLFAGHSVAAFHARLIAEMKQADAGAFYGLSGTQVPYPYNGMDWALLAETFSYHSNYWGGGELPHLHVDFNPACRLAQWTGYGDEGPSARLRTWQRYLWGQSGISFYKEFCLLNPDLRPTRSGLDITNATRDFRRGLGKLLLNSRLIKDRVAIYYSMPSILGCTITGRGDQKNERYGWLWALLDCGIQPKYVSYLDVRNGGLSRKDFDVLVLPLTVSLSPEEAAAVRKFVDEGGTALADSAPGLLSGHCRVLPQGALDSLFGVTHADAVKDRKVEGELKVSGSAHGLTLGEWSQGTSLMTAGVALAGGKALGMAGQTPAYVVHPTGKGKTLYMNCTMARYLELRGGGREQAMREQFRAILDWAGARQAAPVTTPEGRPIDKLVVYRHQNGQAYLLSCVLDAEKDQPARVDFGREGFIYDVRAGKPLGKAAGVSVTLPAKDGLVLAWMPYEVKAVRCVPAAVKPGAEALLTIRLETDGRPALHVVRLEVADPSGSARADLAQNVLLKDGTAVARVPFALNDAPGAWKVALRDVASGVRAEAALNVAP